MQNDMILSFYRSIDWNIFQVWVVDSFIYILDSVVLESWLLALEATEPVSETVIQMAVNNQMYRYNPPM